MKLTKQNIIFTLVQTCQTGNTKDNSPYDEQMSAYFYELDVSLVKPDTL